MTFGSGARALVEGGHFTLRLAPAPGYEPVLLPDGTPVWAATTDTTRWTFRLAAREARSRGGHLGLMVGDLALPTRPVGGFWAVPPSYRAILAEEGVAEVRVWGEAYARNQGKRRLLDEAMGRDPRETYASAGWSLLRDGDQVRLASEAALDWDGDQRTAVLLRGHAPLCPLVFAGLKRAIFQAGYVEHIAVYALADDHWIDVKLRAAAATVAQLFRGAVGPQVIRLVYGIGLAPIDRAWDRLVGPGERPWPEFLAAVRRHHPGVHLLEERCPPTLPPPLPCLTETATSRCSG